ncbi:MAG: cytidylyltransferase domain-containing protein [Alphaproteobacteria bacterium]
MRKLIAALACRNGGSRLYGKPLQRLDAQTTILDQILAMLERQDCIETTVLGISEGADNHAFIELAKDRGIPYIIGDETDVLQRLIQCGHLVSATDIFRMTSECPFLYTEPLAEVWQAHIANANHVTATDGLPEGTHFEIFTLAALEASHDRGTAHHRSEGCSRYIREHRSDFKVQAFLPAADCARMDIRLTVDYPEDLVLCRRVFETLKDEAPLIPISSIIAFLDQRPDLTDLVAPYVKPMMLWADG